MHMKSLLSALAVTTALTTGLTLGMTALAQPALAQTALAQTALAKTVTFQTNLTNYGGRGAYLALYLTDAKGAYAGTITVAGGKTKYFRHLSDWARLSGGDMANAISGASIGAGGGMSVTAVLEDALFDAGYTLHMDAAVEEMRDSPNEIELPLTTAGNGKAVPGRMYIADFSYAF